MLLACRAPRSAAVIPELSGKGSLMRVFASQVVSAMLLTTVVAATPTEGRGILPRHFEGLWAAPSSQVRLIEAPERMEGALAIRRAGWLEAVGFVDDSVCTALLRHRPTADESGGHRLLRLAYVNDSTLTATLAESFSASPSQAERWRRLPTAPAAPSSRAARVRRPDTAALPAYGEFVFADEVPEAISRVEPKYPAEAIIRRTQGIVLVAVLVDTAGRVREARIKRSIRGLDEAALVAARQWRFKPALRQGRPVAMWTGCPVKFSLR